MVRLEAILSVVPVSSDFVASSISSPLAVVRYNTSTRTDSILAINGRSPYLKLAATAQIYLPILQVPYA